MCRARRRCSARSASSRTGRPARWAGARGWPPQHGRRASRSRSSRACYIVLPASVTHTCGGNRSLLGLESEVVCCSSGASLPSRMAAPPAEQVRHCGPRCAGGGARGAEPGGLPDERGLAARGAGGCASGSPGRCACTSSLPRLSGVPTTSTAPAPCSPAQMEQMCDLLIERVHALEKEEGALRYE